MPHQRLFNYVELQETSNLIKALRSSRETSSKNQYGRNIYYSEVDEIELAKAISLYEVDSNKNINSVKEQELKDHKSRVYDAPINNQIHPIDKNIKNTLNQVKIRVCKPNGLFITCFASPETKVQQFKYELEESTGYENIKLYKRTPNLIYLENLNQTISEVIKKPSENIIFIEEIC